MNVRDHEIAAIVKKYEARARVKHGPPVPVEPNDLFVLLKIAEQAPRSDIGGTGVKYLCVQIK